MITVNGEKIVFNEYAYILYKIITTRYLGTSKWFDES